MNNLCVYVICFTWLKVVYEKDQAKDSSIPWYLPLDASQLSLSGFRLTAIGRFFTRTLVLRQSIYFLVGFFFANIIPATHKFLRN
jgi:hypothetical protein